MRMSFLSCVFAIAFTVAVLFSGTNQSISVTGPEKVKQLLPETISGKYSLIGSYKYGVAEQIKMFYYHSKQDADYACKAITAQFSEKINKNVPFAIIVERGNCSFVTKIRNVQNAGAAIAIIVNNKQDDNVIFAMNDDGTGSDIVIPGILISKQIGEVIKANINIDNDDFITGNVDMRNEVSQNKNNIVEVAVNFIANDKKAYSIFNNLNVEVFAQENMKFVPNYITLKNTANAAVNSNNCICSGRYCSYGHNFFQDSFLNDVNSKNVIYESVKQKCIFNKYSLQTYWSYMKQFGNTCLSSNNINNMGNCAKQVISNIKEINFNEVETCFYKSFSFNNDNTQSKAAITDVADVCVFNSILEQDRLTNENKINDVLPVVSINNHTLFGTWTKDNLLEAVCANMQNKPDVCFTELHGVFDNEDRFMLSNTQLVVFALVLVVINVGILMFCRRYVARKEMNNQDITSLLSDTAFDKKINNIVNNYLKMKDTQS